SRSGGRFVLVGAVSRKAYFTDVRCPHGCRSSPNGCCAAFVHRGSVALPPVRDKRRLLLECWSVMGTGGRSATRDGYEMGVSDERERAAQPDRDVPLRRRWQSHGGRERRGARRGRRAGCGGPRNREARARWSRLGGRSDIARGRSGRTRDSTEARSELTLAPLR